MITEFKIFEQSEDIEKRMINDMFSRCSNKKYLDYISREDPDLFVVDDVFDEDEAREHFLEDMYEIEVTKVEDEYLVSFGEFNDEVKNIIGNNPVLLYHYTSSELLKSILDKGLIKGYRRTNSFANSYSGVYLTSESGGNCVRGYVNMAKYQHGGCGIQLYIKKYLKDLVSDPDDADIRSGKYQFITDHVFPNEIIFHEDFHA
jgi:hypothetical protein